MDIERDRVAADGLFYCIPWMQEARERIRWREHHIDYLEAALLKIAAGTVVQGMSPALFAEKVLGTVPQKETSREYPGSPGTCNHAAHAAYGYNACPVCTVPQKGLDHE